MSETAEKYGFRGESIDSEIARPQLSPKGTTYPVGSTGRFTGPHWIAIICQVQMKLIYPHQKVDEKITRNNATKSLVWCWEGILHEFFFFLNSDNNARGRDHYYSHLMSEISETQRD